MLGVLLDLFGPRYKLTRADGAQQVSASATQREAWNSVQLARHESRPTAADYISRIFTSFVELHGDREYGDDRSVLCGLGQLAGQTVVLLAQERGRQGDPATRGGRTRPEGFRKAQRGMKLASKFGLPLISMIDTPGPDLSEEAEQHGLGNAIATTMAMMSALDVPTISVVLGEGGSGGALAMGVADRTMMMEHAIYWAISPEDAAQLIYQDADRVDEAAESLKLTSGDCRELEIIDIIVSEPPGGAHTDPDEAARQLRRALLSELVSLQSQSSKKLLKARYGKYRNIGEYSSHFGAAINREVTGLRSLVASGVRRVTRRGRTEAAPSTDQVATPAQNGEGERE